MESIDDKVLTRTAKRGRGTLIFSSDFYDIAEPKSVLKALERLAKSEKIIRVARGIYCYPKIDKRLGLGILFPTLEEIAQVIAKRDKARIAPTGLYAMNMLGLSTQVPMNIVFLTDASARKIKINDKYTIQFKHTAPKNLAFTNEEAMLIVFALKEIKQDEFNDSHFDRLKKVLSPIPKEVIMADAALIPAWIRGVIEKCYE